MVFPQLKSAYDKQQAGPTIFRKHTIGAQMKVVEEVIGVCLTEIVPVKVQRRKADCGPQHDFPVNLAYQGLITTISKSLQTNSTNSPSPPV